MKEGGLYTRGTFFFGGDNLQGVSHSLKSNPALSKVNTEGREGWGKYREREREREGRGGRGRGRKEGK